MVTISAAAAGDHDDDNAHGEGGENHLLEASFKTSLIIAPMPSKISWSPASHMYAGVVTILSAESTSASWVTATDKETTST